MNMIRRRKTIPRQRRQETDNHHHPGLQENWGGYMPFPPEDCLMRTTAGNALVKSKGVEWIDNIICAFRCTKKCRRRRDFERESRSKAKRRGRERETTNQQ